MKNYKRNHKEIVRMISRIEANLKFLHGKQKLHLKLFLHFFLHDTMSRSEEELLSTDIERYSEAIPHIHEQDGALLKKQEKVLGSKPSWDDIGQAYLEKDEVKMLKKFDSDHEGQIVLMTKVRSYAWHLILFLT